VLDKRDGQRSNPPYDVAIIGDYNIGGDAWATRILLEEMGLRVVPVVRRRHHRRDDEHPEGQAEPAALLPLDELHQPAHGREVRHSLPGIQLLRPDQDHRIPAQDRQPSSTTIKEKTEAVIAKYQPMVDEIIAKYKPRLQGKKVMLYVGGLRPRHVIGAYEDLGMEVIGTGYEFGHNDDYDRTIKEMGDATLLYDDVTGFELEEFVKR
jgi:nitrogenase molybdenum-iron protein alpha chain